MPDTFSVGVHGFEVVGHRSAVTDFTDPAATGAAAVHAERFPGGAGHRRAVATGTWRVSSPPPQDWPLALCDCRSVGPTEGLPNDRYLVAELPADPFGEVEPGARRVPDGSEFRHSPGHRWWYFPDMTRDEVLFFVFHDTDHDRPWRVVHSAFRDPTASATVPRHGIEFRTLAFR